MSVTGTLPRQWAAVISRSPLGLGTMLAVQNGAATVRPSARTNSAPTAPLPRPHWALLLVCTRNAYSENNVMAVVARATTRRRAHIVPIRLSGFMRAHPPAISRGQGSPLPVTGVARHATRQPPAVGHLCFSYIQTTA